MIIKSFSNTKEKVHSREIEIEAFEREDVKLIIPRKNQVEIMENYYNSKYFQLIQPPGSGKSITISYVMAKRLIDDLNLKLIICVPQTFISKSFGRMILNYNGKHIEWNCYHNLCESSSFSKIAYLINFLKNKDTLEDIRTRIAITTHISFAQAVEKLQVVNDVFDNVMVVIDEAHHVMYDDSETSNKIGNFIKNVFKNKLNTGIWLATATPYRSDNNNMIPKEILNQFDKHFLPLDKHWENNIKYIKSFAFNFVIYKQNQILNEVKEVFKLGHKKSIIFCPYVGHLVNDIDKNVFKRNLIDSIKEVWPDCKILDLIEVGGRNKRKDILQDNKDAKHVDVILTLKIFDEGSDWVHAEQCLDLTPSNHLRIMYQRFGRLWRDYFKKHNIIYYCFLPFEAKFKDEDERRLHLSKSFNALAVSLLLQDIVQPIKYPSRLKGSHKNINPFHKAIPDEDKRSEMLEKIIKKLLVMKSVSDNPSPQDVKQWIKCALTSENIINNQDEIVNYIGLVFRRMSNQTHLKKPDWSSSFDINKLIEGGFDKIWANDIFENLRIFGTNLCTAETFKEFREIINGKYNNVEYWFEYLKEINDLENRLITSLPVACLNMIRKYPDKFSQFKFKKEKNKRYSYWFEYLQEIKDPVTGKVPPISSLPRKCQYAIRKYPDDFSQFEFEVKLGKLEYWIKFAHENKDPVTGKVPPISSLPAGFQRIALKYPEVFLQFKSNMKRKDINYWIKFAHENKDLVTGKLPLISSLPIGFQSMVRKHRNKFSQFKFERRYKCQQE